MLKVLKDMIWKCWSLCFQRAWLLCREGGDLATLAVWHVQVPTFPPSLNFFLSTILIQFLEFTKLAVHILSQFLSQFLLPFFHQSSLRYDIGNCLFEAAYEEVLRRYFHCHRNLFLDKIDFRFVFFLSLAISDVFARPTSTGPQSTSPISLSTDPSAK